MIIHNKAMDKKYNKTLTIILVIAVIAIFALGGFWIYDVIKSNIAEREASDAAARYNNQVQNQIRRNPVDGGDGTNGQNSDNQVSNLSLNDLAIDNTSSTGSTQSKTATQTYKGFTMYGTISIPKIEVNYPIVRSSKAALEHAVVLNYGELNAVGNAVLEAHNYHNSQFFSKIDQLKNGDSIYIVDNSGKRIQYKVYSVYEANSEEKEYYYRDTAGKREISLSTCTSVDNTHRTIILAREAE